MVTAQDQSESGIHVLLEVGTASLDGVLTAQSLGADRVELNAALELGGLTPSPGVVDRVLEQSKVPVVAMVRPRPSAFCYSQDEFATLLRDAQWLVERGVAGIAFGVLTASATIDVDRCREIVGLASAHHVESVFHRAFDLVDDPFNELDRLIECGITRVMTSGGRPTAQDGQPVIRRLVEQAGNAIQIMAAGGIRPDHASQLVTATGVRQIHAGPTRLRSDPSSPETGPVNFYATPPKNPAHFRESCESTIAALVQQMHEPRRQSR